MSLRTIVIKIIKLMTSENVYKKWKMLIAKVHVKINTQYEEYCIGIFQKLFKGWTRLKPFARVGTSF